VEISNYQIEEIVQERTRNLQQIVTQLVAELARRERVNKNLEKQMARLSGLDFIGQTAASIGHEIRNPMTTVRGFLQMLSTKLDCAQYQSYYSLMIEELDRANSIITEFLTLAKDSSNGLQRKNLNEVLQALEPLLKVRAVAKDSDFVLEQGDIPDIMLNEQEIRQLLLNLVNNGLEAMPDGGRLTVKTGWQAGQVVLAVADQGTGIPGEILGKLGTPFLTTKDEGTGLGLAVCYNIATNHDAVIDVDTGPGGTTFFVRFPA